MAGRFIALEGGDGCGKSTQARLLADATVGVTDVVEGVHIGVAPATVGGGLAPLTYRTIRSATRFIGAGMDAALTSLGADTK